LTALRRNGQEFPVESTIWPIRVGSAYCFNAFIRDTTQRQWAEAELRRAHDELEARVQERTRELAAANAALQAAIGERERAEQERARLLIREQETRRSLEESNAALARATQAKSEFLAAMSHELRTPLNSILGFAELLLDDSSDGATADERQRFVANIRESGEHLLGLVNNILDLAKVEAGRMELYRETFDVQLSLHAAQAALLPLAEKKRLRFTMRVGPEVETLHADEVKFRQVLYNLLSNAVKFTPEGGRVEIAAELVDGAVQVVVAEQLTLVAKTELKVETKVNEVPSVTPNGEPLEFPPVMKFVPVIVTVLPPAVGPEAGEMKVIVGVLGVLP